MSDPRGDATGKRPNAARRELADVTAVRFNLLSRNDPGVAVLRVKFANLKNRSASGGLNQGLLMLLRSAGRTYEVTASSRSSRPRFRTQAGSERFRPERAELTKRTGRGGSLAVSFSTEFLDGRRVSMKAVGVSRDFSNPDKSAFDYTPKGLFEFPG